MTNEQLVLLDMPDLAGHRPRPGGWGVRRNVARRQGGRARLVTAAAPGLAFGGLHGLRGLGHHAVVCRRHVDLGAGAFGCLTAMAGADVAIDLYERWAAKRIGVCEVPPRDNRQDH